jgi:succinate dehydrogenase / fumarate reductase membrane anchor subunit
MRNTYLWFVQLVTGVLIAVFLGIHLVLLHLDAILDFFGVDTAELTSWESMMDRSSQGIFVGLYVALLAFGLYHGINGLRGIILESTSSAKTERVVTWVLIVLGIIIFGWGTWVPFYLFTG